MESINTLVTLPFPDPLIEKLENASPRVTVQKQVVADEAELAAARARLSQPSGAEGGNPTGVVEVAAPVTGRSQPAARPDLAFGPADDGGYGRLSSHHNAPATPSAGAVQGPSRQQVHGSSRQVTGGCM